jgi:hypothetical protein
LVIIFVDQKDSEKVEDNKEEAVVQPSQVENPEAPKPVEPEQNAPAEPNQSAPAEAMFKAEDVKPSEEENQNVESEQDQKPVAEGDQPNEAPKEGEIKEENKSEGAPKEEDQKKEEGKAADANQNPAKEEEKEADKKSESEYEDVEDPEFDVFNSDDSTEKRRIIPIDYRWGGKGYLRKECIKKKIIIYVKTFYASRTKHRFEVDINSKVGTLIGKTISQNYNSKIEKLGDEEEIASYHVIKFMYPMGRMRSVSLTETFAQQNIPENACLVMIGKKDFCWDTNRRGRNITVRLSFCNHLYSCIMTS